MERRVVPGVYRHFKGGMYCVLTTATHTETEEELVVYRSLEEPSKIWVRPVKMFCEKVDRNGKLIDRFELIEGHPNATVMLSVESSRKWRMKYGGSR